MAKKKSEEKPVDRTQIYVAIIGVFGTIAVALITVLANRPSASAPTPTTNVTSIATNASGQGTAQGGPTNTPFVSPNGGLCLEDYFSAVTAENRQDLQAGISTRFTAKKDGVFGIRLFENGKVIGELQFTGEANTKSFKVVSVIDASCSPVFDFGNLDRPTAKGAIANWENLGLPFSSGMYRLRMGWYTGSQIELMFSSN
jgi:hypothetical protein